MVILFEEIFANVKCFNVETFIKSCKLLNETKKMRKFWKILFPLVEFCFKCDVISVPELTFEKKPSL